MPYTIWPSNWVVALAGSRFWREGKPERKYVLAEDVTLSVSGRRVEIDRPRESTGVATSTGYHPEQVGRAATVNDVPALFSWPADDREGERAESGRGGTARWYHIRVTDPTTGAASTVSMVFEDRIVLGAGAAIEFYPHEFEREILEGKSASSNSSVVIPVVSVIGALLLALWIGSE